jgi:hypothetical protein
MQTTTFLLLKKSLLSRREEYLKSLEKVLQVIEKSTSTNWEKYFKSPGKVFYLFLKALCGILRQTNSSQQMTMVHRADIMVYGALTLIHRAGILHSLPGQTHLI